MLVLLGGIFVMTSCQSTEKKSDTNPDRKLVLAIGGEPNTGFDPTTGWGRYGAPLFQSTLLKYDANFKVINDLAVAHQVSDDGLQWTVTIRDDVKFSDGKPLTIADVIFTFKTAKNSRSVIDLTNLKSIEKIGPQQVQFTLKKPNSTFIYHLIKLGIVPKHAYDQSYGAHPIGSGPYQMVQWNKGQQLIVKANPYYYGKTPYFKKLTFLFLSKDAGFAAAKAGKVDVVAIPPAFSDEKIDGMRLVPVKSVDNRGIVMPYLPNTGKKTKKGYPIGNDVTAHQVIRKALNIAVDRQALVDGVLEGYGKPAYTVADHLPWWNPKTVIEDGKMEKAKKMLTNAGWLPNANGIREKNGLQAKFTLFYPSNDPVRQSLAIAFADMVKPLGVKVETKRKSWNELRKLMHAHPVLFGLGSHTPLEMYRTFSSTTRGEGLYNVNYYSDSTVDKYLNKALHATSRKKAMNYWKKAQWDGTTGFSAKGDAVWVWLVNLDHLYFIDQNLVIGEQKIQPHGHGWPITASILQWHYKNNNAK